MSNKIEIFNNIKEWGLERGIICVTDDKEEIRSAMLAQINYSLKEYAEICEALAEDSIPKLIDAVGDIAITLVNGIASNKDESFENGFSHFIYRNPEFFEVGNFNLEDVKTSFKFQMSYVLQNILDIRINLEQEGLGYSDYWSEYRNVLQDLLYLTNMINTIYDVEYSLYDCMSIAYDEIKDRKGTLKNGQFIKENN